MVTAGGGSVADCGLRVTVRLDDEYYLTITRHSGVLLQRFSKSHNIILMQWNSPHCLICCGHRHMAVVEYFIGFVSQYCLGTQLRSRKAQIRWRRWIALSLMKYSNMPLLQQQFCEVWTWDKLPIPKEATHNIFGWYWLYTLRWNKWRSGAFLVLI